MKTREELFAIRNEIAALNTKLSELNDDELKEVVGGIEWIKEDDEQTGAWYGLENDSKNHRFEPGSRFWVRWLHENTEKKPDEN